MIKPHAPNLGIQLTDEIFVFGSNLAGIHGKGAARDARIYYGAEYGVGEGLTGGAYAIPTKDYRLETLPLYVIKRHVDKFLLFAKTNTDLRFFITNIGCGLAGYTPEEIAPMFRGVGNNCTLSKEFLKVLNNERL